MPALTASVYSCVPVCVQTRGRSYCRTARYCQDRVAHISQCCNRFSLVHVAEWGIPVSEIRLSSTSVSRFAHAKERTEPLRESKPRHLFLIDLYAGIASSWSVSLGSHILVKLICMLETPGKIHRVLLITTRLSRPIRAKVGCSTRCARYQTQSKFSGSAIASWSSGIAVLEIDIW